MMTSCIEEWPYVREPTPLGLFIHHQRSSRLRMVFWLVDEAGSRVGSAGINLIDAEVESLDETDSLNIPLNFKATEVVRVCGFAYRARPYNPLLPDMVKTFPTTTMHPKDTMVIRWSLRIYA